MFSNVLLKIVPFMR